MKKKYQTALFFIFMLVTPFTVYADKTSDTFMRSVANEDMNAAHKAQTYFADPFCYDINPFHGITIIKAINGRVVTPAFPFTYQDMTHIKVRKLHDRIGIDEMIRKSDSEFGLIVLMCDWANGLFGHMRPLPFPSWDAHEVLDRIEQGDTFFCTYKAVLFVQACNAAGLTARILGISRKHGNAHTVTEVYSNEYRKWVLVDPWMNCYFERDSIPLSARELHDSIENPEKINMVIGPRGKIQESKNYQVGAIDSMPGAGKRIPISDDKQADMYYDIRVVLRNDHTVHPQETETYSDDGFMIPYNPRGIEWWGPQLKWTDDKTSPSITCDNTNNTDDFEWPLNEVKVDLKKITVPGAPLVLNATFSTLTPCFSHYRLLIDGKEVPLSGDNFTWKLREGTNTLRITAVNTTGRHGFPSEFTIEYDPASIDYSEPVTVEIADTGMEMSKDNDMQPAHWKAIKPNAMGARIYSLDRKTKHSGSYSIKASPSKDPKTGVEYAFVVMSEQFRVNPASDIVYSIWLKADKKNTPAYLFLWDESRNGLGGGQFHKEITLDTKWKRYEIKCRLHNELTLASVGFKILKGTVWADDVEFSEVKRSE
ncbi:transglutaminase domain-containing protein [Candidatus Latescibacterota bacterium]